MKSYEYKTKTYRGQKVYHDSHGYLIRQTGGSFVTIGPTWKEAKQYLDTMTGGPRPPTADSTPSLVPSPSVPIPPDGLTPDERAAYRKAAEDIYGSDDIEVDADARFSPNDQGGCWVQGWLWVRSEEAGLCTKCRAALAENNQGGLCTKCAPEAAKGE